MIKAVILLSVVVLSFLFWIIYGEKAGVAPTWTAHLPAVNALFNTLTAVVLVLGVRAVKKGRVKLHKRLMVTATLLSILFLVGYVVYHHYQGDTKFMGKGLVRPFYFFVLISHILLSIVQVPLILFTHLFAWTGDIGRHRALARWTFPTWLYVSVTGVGIFLLLKAFNPSL